MLLPATHPVSSSPVLSAGPVAGPVAGPAACLHAACLHTAAAHAVCAHLGTLASLPALHLSPANLGTLAQALFLIQLGGTLALCGLIWFVQLVHYPLFLRIGEAQFLAYERDHANRTGWIAFPLMSAELLSSLLLLAPRLRLPGLTSASAWIGAALVLLLWASTVVIQIPLHNRLHRTFDRAAIRTLIRSNWLRTAAWTLRGALVLRWALHLT